MLSIVSLLKILYKLSLLVCRIICFLYSHSDNRIVLLYVYSFHSLYDKGLSWVTVSASNLTCLIPLQVGISVFVTGGIGGVHREGETSKGSQSLPLWSCVCFRPITLHKYLLDLPFLKKPAQYIGLQITITQFRSNNTILKSNIGVGDVLPSRPYMTVSCRKALCNWFIKFAITCQFMTICGYVWQPWMCPQTWQSLAVLQ